MTRRFHELAIAVLAGALLCWPAAGAAQQSPQSGSSAATTSTAAPQQNASAAGLEPVTVDLLKDEPGKYVNRRVLLDGDVQTVLGPRLFTLDERNWGNLNGELLVFTPSALAVAVRNGDHITVAGTVQRFNNDDFEREWGWLPLDGDTERRLAGEPVLVATQLGLETQPVLPAATTRVPQVSKHEIPPSPVGTAGASRDRDVTTLTSAPRVVAGTDSVVGRSVNLADLGVSSVAHDRGFFVNAGTGQLFVLTDPGSAYMPAVGDRVDLEGIILRFPTHMRAAVDAPARMNGDIYVFATAVRKR